jgi:putative DNA primase/helicase
LDETRRLGGLDGQRLDFLRRTASDVLRAVDERDELILRDAMLDAGLTAGSAAEARALEWRCKIDVQMHPSMTQRERKEATRAAVGNRTIRRLAMFWRAMENLLQDDGPEASGWARLATNDTKEGPVRVLRLKARKAVADGWQVPTMLLDATLNIDFVRHFWPNAELVADVAVQTPHQRIRQATDRSNSKRHLEPDDDLPDAENDRRTTHLRKLNATLAAISRAYAPGQTLAVTQKAIHALLPTVGKQPASTAQAWHNGVSGIDQWKHVSSLVVVGRTAPIPAEVERIAEALTGRAMGKLAGWYPKVATTRLMANGPPIQAECDRHPEPTCEAIRWQINEGELIQIIGRARGVNRTADDPVDIWVLTDTVLPLALTEILSAADLDPNPTELMLGCAGVALENASDAARAFPDLWDNYNAARKAFERARAVQTATLSYKYNIYTGLSRSAGHNPLRRVRYQRAGERLKPATAWVDPTIVSDPETWLTDKLGTLSKFKFDDAPEAPAAEPTREPFQAVLILPGTPALPHKRVPWHPPQPPGAGPHLTLTVVPATPPHATGQAP